MDKAIVKKRVEWIDVARGLAFLAVIYHHLDGTVYFCPLVDSLYLPAYLSVFFFISGFLFKENLPFKKVLEQRTRTLLLPLIILGTIMILLQHIFTFREEPVSWGASFKGLFLQKGENQLLWFVGALYLYSLIFYFIERIDSKINKTGGGILLIFSAFLYILNWGYSYVLKGTPLPWTLHFAGFGVSYMCLGKYYKINEGKINDFFNNKIIALLLVVYLFIIVGLNVTCSFSGSRYCVEGIVLSLLGIIIMIGVCKSTIIEKSRLLKFIGSNSLFYFAFHGKALAQTTVTISLALGKFGMVFSSLGNTIAGLLCVLLTTVLLILPAYLTNRYFPWMLGKGFKLW